jgi:hypothetical protein
MPNELYNIHNIYASKHSVVLTRTCLNACQKRQLGNRSILRVRLASSCLVVVVKEYYYWSRSLGVRIYLELLSLYSKSDVLYIVAFGPQIIQVAICLTWYQSQVRVSLRVATSVLQVSIWIFFFRSVASPISS